MEGPSLFLAAENAALGKMALHAEEEIGDVLLEQEIFSGVGNIIKNEVLFLAKINPKKSVRSLTKKREWR